MSTLQQLEDAYDAQATANIKKILSNNKYRINPNDVIWLYHDPQVYKAAGRAKRVFKRLSALND